jgi:hypothetical protein
MGTSGAFLAGDLFNLYVWFEVLLMSSFVLMSLGGTRPQLEGSLKYVTLSLISSTLFLLSAGLLYALAGTLNMADLARVLPQSPKPGVVAALALLLVSAYAIKAVRAAAPKGEAESAGRLECRWQREQLPDQIRELVLDDERLRNGICWSAFDC